MSSSFLVRLPDEIATRLRATVPPRQRNQFIADLVAQALARQDDELARIADQVNEEERDPALRRELDAWERTTIRDGIDEPV
jgi:predicted transcriptional regulator